MQRFLVTIQIASQYSKYIDRSEAYDPNVPNNRILQCSVWYYLCPPKSDYMKCYNSQHAENAHHINSAISFCHHILTVSLIKRFLKIVQPTVFHSQ